MYIPKFKSVEGLWSGGNEENTLNRKTMTKILFF